MKPGIETDLLGDSAVVTIDPTVYSETAIFKTAYWFTDRFYLYLDRTAAGAVRVELRSKEGLSADLVQSCSEFCNSLIDFQVRELVSRETAGIREALVKHAFLQGVPRPGFAGAISDEGALLEKPAVDRV